MLSALYSQEECGQSRAWLYRLGADWFPNKKEAHHGRPAGDHNSERQPHDLRPQGIHDPQDFKAGLSGALLRPTEAGYDDARKIWNGMIDKRPALIARCRGVADVIGCPFASLARTIFCWRCEAEATTWPAMRYAMAA